MNGCVGGERPSEGRASGALNHSLVARRPPAALNPPPTLSLRPRPGRVIPCPRGSGAAVGSGSGTGARRGRATAAGLHAPAFSARAERPLGREGNLEVRSRLEAPGPALLCLGLVLCCFPTMTCPFRHPSPPASGLLPDLRVSFPTAPSH